MPERPVLSETSASRARLIFAGAAALMLAALVAVAALAGSGGESSAAPAPPECIRSWNSERVALADGRHIALNHNYTEAQVGYMAADGGGVISEKREGRECVVVFARTTLDPELEYAAQIELKGGWTPLSALVGARKLAELQANAIGNANATPTADGRLAPL